jgi:hypothetical protein
VWARGWFRLVELLFHQQSHRLAGLVDRWSFDNPSDEVFTHEFGYNIMRDVVDRGGMGRHKGRGSNEGHGRGR